MKKRLFCLLLCAVLVIGLMPVFTFADDDAEDTVISDNNSVLETVSNTESVDPVLATDSNSESVESVDPDDNTNTISDDSVAEPTDDAVEISNNFSDVGSEDWYYEYVNYVVDKGLMNGVGDGKFDPNGNITRGMVATIIYRLEGEPAFMNDNTYTDVAQGSYYEKAIIWCSSGKTGIVQGYGNDLFGPDDNITREQLAKMLYNYACYKELGFQDEWMFYLDYSDRDSISDWAYEPMCWCVMNGIINGYDTGCLNPQGTATRAEAAKMLKAFVENSGSNYGSGFVGDFENPEGNRISIDDNGDGTYTVYARIVPKNAEYTDSIVGIATPEGNDLSIDFIDPNGNHLLAVYSDAGYAYELQFTASMWDAVASEEVFEGFVKK